MPAYLNGPGEQGFTFDYDNARLTEDGLGVVIERTLPRPPEERTYTAAEIVAAVERCHTAPPGEKVPIVNPEHRAKWETLLTTYGRLRKEVGINGESSHETTAVPVPGQGSEATTEYSVGRKRRGRPPGSRRAPAAAA